MKNLRKQIKDNKDIFDDQEPMEGHFERFEALLDKQEKEKRKPIKRMQLMGIISIAASIVVLMVVAIQLYSPQHIPNDLPVIENTMEVSDEFRATNDFYNRQMQEQIADIMCKLANTDSENQALLNRDLQKIIDGNAAFVNDMANADDEEMAIHYLVKHYKANIQALENINEKLGKYTKC